MSVRPVMVVMVTVVVAAVHHRCGVVVRVNTKSTRAQMTVNHRLGPRTSRRIRVSSPICHLS